MAPSWQSGCATEGWRRRRSSRLAEPDHPDAPLLALALADLQPLREYFDRLQHVQLDIGGRRARRARPGRVAAGGGDPRRATAPEAERRARRPRVRAGCSAGADRSAVILRWEAPGPYEVLFTTRQGGVSEGPFESLNLGKAVGDDPDRVDENRRRVCAEAGADPELLTLNRQRHSATVHRAEPGSRGVPGDGLWSDRPGQPMLALSADCLTIARRADERRRTGSCRPPRGLARAARRDRRGGLRRARRREARSRRRAGNRAVLLRGRRGGGRAVRAALRTAD